MTFEELERAAQQKAALISEKRRPKALQFYRRMIAHTGTCHKPKCPECASYRNQEARATKT